jgi:two-component system, NtrC family, sensor kinase
MSHAILIVDDSLTVRMDLADAFTAAGMLPRPCATAAEARETLARGAVALVILDVLLPDADGVELLKELRALPAMAGVPILMLSSEAEVKDRVRGLQTGADEYVGKPYEIGYVVARARELIAAAQPARVSVSGTAVLVIDDSPTFREVLRSALVQAGYPVLLAATGEEGLRLAAGQRPSAILVDGMLPGIDGATVIRRVRLDAALRGVPCVLLTASEDVDSELRALDAGADTFVRKDDDIEVILARLTAVLRRAAWRRPMAPPASSGRRRSWRWTTARPTCRRWHRSC